MGAHRRNSRRPPSAFLHAGFLSLASPAYRPWRRGLTRGSNHCNLWTKHPRAFSARFNIMVDIPSQARTDRRPHRTEDASRSKPVAGNLQLRHQHVRMTSAKRLCDRYDYASPLVCCLQRGRTWLQVRCLLFIEGKACLYTMSASPEAAQIQAHALRLKKTWSSRSCWSWHCWKMMRSLKMNWSPRPARQHHHLRQAQWHRATALVQRFAQLCLDADLLAELRYCLALCLDLLPSHRLCLGCAWRQRCVHLLPLRRQVDRWLVRAQDPSRHPSSALRAHRRATGCAISPQYLGLWRGL